MRTPMKGCPDFSSVSDERLKGYVDLAQQLIFAYQQCDEEKTRVLTEVWKQMSDEYSDRLCASACASLDKQGKEQEVVPPAVHKIKMVKRIKR